jgi:hypothetical protein
MEPSRIERGGAPDAVEPAGRRHGGRERPGAERQPRPGPRGGAPAAEPEPAPAAPPAGGRVDVVA